MSLWSDVCTFSTSLQFPLPTALAIADINANRDADNSWYTIQGKKLSGKPSAAGIYLNGGKKVIVK